jgi:hypothetical protein
VESFKTNAPLGDVSDEVLAEGMKKAFEEINKVGETLSEYVPNILAKPTCSLSSQNYLT